VARTFRVSAVIDAEDRASSTIRSVSGSVDSLTATEAEFREEIERLKGSLDETEASLKAQGSAADDTAEKTKKLGGETETSSKRADTFGRVVSSLATRLRSLLIITPIFTAITALGGAISAATASAIAAAPSYDRLRASVLGLYDSFLLGFRGSSDFEGGVSSLAGAFERVGPSIEAFGARIGGLISGFADFVARVPSFLEGMRNIASETAEASTALSILDPIIAGINSKLGQVQGVLDGASDALVRWAKSLFDAGVAASGAAAQNELVSASADRAREAIAREELELTKLTRLLSQVGLTLKSETIPSFELVRDIITRADEAWRKGTISLEQLRQIEVKLGLANEELGETTSDLAGETTIATSAVEGFTAAQIAAAQATAELVASMQSQVNLWRTNPDVFRGDFARQAAERRRRLSGAQDQLFPQLGSFVTFTQGASVVGSTPGGGTFTTIRRARATPSGGVVFY
jgi:hypothetical protein